MRKNNPLMFVKFSDTGEITSSDLLEERLRKYLPLPCQDPKNGVKTWWNNRAVPIGQGGIKDVLNAQGFKSPEQYLLKNLGLSLTDCYWVKPFELENTLKWEDINLYENFFDDNKFISEYSSSSTSYSPNGSLQGQIKKTWVIRGNKRFLLKGNRSNYSVESINEVIASELHRLQEYDNYTVYELEKIPQTPYDYGCLCELFTSENVEFVSAHDIYSMTKKRNDVSNYEHFIVNCGYLGMNTEKLRQDLEYQIVTDFILSQNDRHFNNFGILRNSETLEPIRMAPIFDSGACLFANQELPHSIKDLKNIKTNSFFEKERSLLKVVRDYNAINIDKLPSPSYIENMYKVDTKYPSENIFVIISAYKNKIEMYKKLLEGKNPFR